MVQPFRMRFIWERKGLKLLPLEDGMQPLRYSASERTNAGRPLKVKQVLILI